MGLGFVALAVLSVVVAAAVQIMGDPPGQEQERRAEGFGVGSAILSIVAVVVLIVGNNNEGSHSHAGQASEKAVRQTERQLELCAQLSPPPKPCFRLFGTGK